MNADLAVSLMGLNNRNIVGPVISSMTDVNEKIDDEKAQRITDINNIIAIHSTDTERLAAVTALTLAFEADDATVIQTLTNTISGETSARQQADTGLQNQINGNDTDILANAQGVAVNAGDISTNEASITGITQKLGTVTSAEFGVLNGIGTATTLSAQLAQRVAITGNQSIAGQKTFTDATTFSSTIEADSIDGLTTWDAAVITAAKLDLTSKQDVVGDDDLAISHVQNLATQLAAKQATIGDGDLSIARTTGLQTALDGKHPTLTFGLANENSLRIDATGGANSGEYCKFTTSGIESKSVSSVKTDLSLNNVNNTSDADKTISTLTQAALDSKANSSNPTLTGTVNCTHLKNTTGHLKLESTGNDLNCHMSNTETLQLTRKDAGTLGIEVRYQANGGTGRHRFMNDVRCAQDVKIYSGNTIGTTLKSPANSSDITLTLPPTTGSSGQFMKTDGNGVLSFGTGVSEVGDYDFVGNHSYSGGHARVPTLLDPDASYDWNSNDTEQFLSKDVNSYVLMADPSNHSDSYRHFLFLPSDCVAGTRIGIHTITAGYQNRGKISLGCASITDRMMKSGSSGNFNGFSGGSRSSSNSNYIQIPGNGRKYCTCVYVDPSTGGRWWIV